MSPLTEVLHIRRASEDDVPAIIGLLTSTLGWLPDAYHQAFFAWKHLDNPFGRSPAWIAWDGDTIAGFRTFLRWEFEREGGVIRAVRAVDTATRPDYRGQGIFTRLTLQALTDLAEEDLGFVFNTPNDQSRPGYLKMGWQVVGRVPVAMRPASWGRWARVAQARQAAELTSMPCTLGDPAREALATLSDGDLVAGRPPALGLQTHRTADYYRWRYGFAPLGYRIVAAGDQLRDGFAVFRLRRRGAATEAAVVDVAARSRSVERRLVSHVARHSGCDYAVSVGTQAVRRGMLPVPRQGPVLTWRGLPDGRAPALGDWRLSLGDVELF